MRSSRSLGRSTIAVLMRIVETEATPAEVLEAFTWATADDQTWTEPERGTRGAVQVCEIVKREEHEPDASADNPYMGSGR